MPTENLRSIAYLTVAGAEPVEQIEAAAAAGLDGVGLRVVAPLGLDLAYPIVGNNTLIQRIREACRQTGVRVFDAEVITLAPHTDIAQLVPMLSAAAEVGATYMQMTSEDPVWSRGVDNFGKACDEAARFGLKIALEFMRWRSVRNIEEAARFVGEARRPNGGIVLDTLHLSRSGGSPEAVARVPPEYLMYVQLCDARATSPVTDEAIIAEARGGRLDPGAGDLWLEAALDVLPDNVPISIEVPGAAPQGSSVLERSVLAAKGLDTWLAAYRSRKA